MTTKPANDVSVPPFGRSLDAAALLAGEEWRPVPFAPHYEVSNLGRLWAHPRRRASGTNYPGKLLKAGTRPKGYRYAQLTLANGVTRYWAIHRLVLEAFVGPCPEGMETRHLNGVRNDNRLSNLRWDTHAENIADIKKHGHIRPMRGELCGRAKLKTEQVRSIIERVAAGESRTLLAEEHGVSLSCVRSIAAGRIWKHLRAS